MNANQNKISFITSIELGALRHLFLLLFLLQNLFILQNLFVLQSPLLW